MEPSRIVRVINSTEPAFNNKKHAHRLERQALKDHDQRKFFFSNSMKLACNSDHILIVIFLNWIKLNLNSSLILVKRILSIFVDLNAEKLGNSKNRPKSGLRRSAGRLKVPKIERNRIKNVLKWTKRCKLEDVY